MAKSKIVKPKRNDLSAKSKDVGKRKAKILNKKTDEGEYNGVGWESGCELACLYWLFTLKRNGYIDYIGRAHSYLLADAVVNNYSQELKRSSKPMEQTILRGHSYTPDFEITFTKKAIGKFAWIHGSNLKFDNRLFVAHPTDNPERFKCVIEVKPDFNFGNKTDKAINDMKWVFQKFGTFVNLFKPNHRFDLTFTPEEYKFTERGIRRKLNFNVRNLSEYLNK